MRKCGMLVTFLVGSEVEPAVAGCVPSVLLSRSGVAVAVDHGVANRDLLRVLVDARDAAEAGAPEADAMIDRARSLLPPVERSQELALRARLHFARTLMIRAERDDASAWDGPPARLLEASSELAAVADAADRLHLALLASHASGFRATIYLRSGRLDDALALNQRALLAAQAVNDPEALARWSSQQGHILLSQGRRADARQAFEQARPPLERLRTSMEVHDYLDLASPILLPLADLLLRESAESRAEEQMLLEEARRALEGLKAAELRDYFGDPCLAAEVQTEAGTVPGAVILYPVILEDRVELIVARGGRLERVRSTASPGELVEQARLLSVYLSDPTTMRFRGPSERLYEWLVRPIESRLDERTEALVFVPPRPLLRVPFAALRDGQSGRFLIERVPVAVTPSLLLTDPRPIDARHTRALIAGLTTETGGFQALPAVSEEIRSVGEVFPGTILEGDRFTLKRFESTFDSRPFGVVHIASHGSFAGRSEDSFVLTHDSRMTISRLAEIVGRARHRDREPLELLTLSTCESAIGDERAMLGLAGIAVQSGARSAVATLWKVDDRATARLMRKFYRELAKPGASRARSLQRAQNSLLADERFRHPSRWAAFVLINSWL